MLDGSKRTIAVLATAACLGAGGWALADTVGGGSAGSSTGNQTIQTTGPQGPAPSGHPCDHSGRSGDGGRSGGGGPAPTPQTDTSPPGGYTARN